MKYLQMSFSGAGWGYPFQIRSMSHVLKKDQSDSIMICGSLNGQGRAGGGGARTLNPQIHRKM
eukprot:760119-Hanusia_phi.AAC.2